MSDYIPTIGVEVHVQVKTDSKLFCRCSARFGDEPNTNICPICMGMPGVMPTINREAVNKAVKAALALNCTVNNISGFARKNYFYPDLPKGYQITQYQYPIAENGYIELNNGKKVRIRRLHIEEDTGKLIHDKEEDSLVDYNRSGVPLIEIVTEPDIDNEEEAVEYLQKLRLIIRYCRISDADMEKGQLRAEPNISIRKHEEDVLGQKTEIKNLNSFKAVSRGIQAEIRRQTDMLNNGEAVEGITMLYNDKAQDVTPMRKKETAGDYRYFPEPDLPDLKLENDYIEKIAQHMPELPDAKKKRLIEQYSIKEKDADTIISSSHLAVFYEESMKDIEDIIRATNFIIKEFLALLNKNNLRADKVNFSAQNMNDLLKYADKGRINLNTASSVLQKMQETGKNPADIIKEDGLEQTDNADEIRKIIEEVMKENPDEYKRYKEGEKKLRGFFIGQIMKKTGGKADPKTVNQMLNKI